MCIHNPLSVKHFHGVSAGKVHECSLKLSINWLRVFLIFLTYGHRSRKHVHMRPIHRWSTRATHAVIMCIPVHALPWCATPCSDGTVLVYRRAQRCTPENSQPVHTHTIGAYKSPP